MITAEQRALLDTLLNEHPTAVLATADAQSVPAAAVVLFAADDQGRIIFGTHPTRKYHNLKANPQAAMVFTKDMVSLQIHGPVVLLDGAAAEAATKTFMAKHPEADKQLMAGSVFFQLTPAWLRYMDMTSLPPVTFEGKM